MNWRHVCVWLQQYAFRSTVTTAVSIILWMVTIPLIYYLLYSIMNSMYLFLLVNDLPMWLKLYYMVSTATVVYYLCEFIRLVLALFLLEFFVALFLFQPFALFILDVLICKYRSRSQVPMMGRRTKWKSGGNLPFFDTFARRVAEVKICDADPLNDPFWPEYVSIVHMVEVRIWDPPTNWYELTIYRVSTIGGHREKLHTAQLSNPDYFVADPLKCFESNGLIAIVLATSTTLNSFLLYLYDTHFDQSAVYQCAQSFSVTHVDTLVFIAISCQARLLNQQQQLKGWKIRLIHCDRDPGNVWHARLVNSLLELGEDGRLISQEEITSQAFSSPVWLPIRSSDGNSVGLYCMNVQAQNGPIFLYNLSTRKYTWTTCRRFCQNDWRFVATNPTRGYDMYPIVLNRRQCVKLSPPDGTIYTMEFAGRPTATLKLQAAQALIRRNQIVREMDQEQFRRLTGVGPIAARMGARPHLNQWPTVISDPVKVSL